MTNLLDLALAAHGGLERWLAVGSLELEASIDGELFRRRGHAGALSDVHISVDTGRQRLAFGRFKHTDDVAVFEADRVSVLDEDGQTTVSRSDPRVHFEGQAMTDLWDDLDLVFAQGYGQYALLTAPFTLALPGVTTREISPHHEAGEVWRRLEATFPTSFVTHRSPQTFAFDSQGLLRRHDFTPGVGAVPPSAVYAADYQDVAGLQIATRRVNVPVDPDGRADENRTYMVVEITHATVARHPNIDATP